MLEPGTPSTYQCHVSLIGISPMIWRRLVVSGDSTIADLHYILQIAMGWSDDHLNRFTIHGKDYGVYPPGGICFSDEPSQVHLADLVRTHVLDGEWRSTFERWYSDSADKTA